MKYPEDFINKIIQGDCLEIMKQMPDKCVDLVLTDPPYGMAYQSSWRTDKHEKIALDDNIDWFGGFAKELFRLMKEDTHAYIFCNEYAISHFRDELEKAGFVNKRTLVWVKNNHTSGDLEGDYANKTEFLLYAQKGRRLLNGGRDTNVLNFARVNTDNHPTEKPTEMCKYLIEKSSQLNEIVFDPFLGSGTTAVSAKHSNRNYIGIELSQKYVDVANERLKQNLLF
jgi:site-specific DNA-methyltransferase (adenine-specific)